MPTLDDLIIRANNVLAVLEDLIEGDAAETPIAETGDAPTYDEATGLWTCAQATANANGEYLGIYKLPLATLCSILDSLDIIAFTAPQPPNTPARLLPCGADPLTGWTNLPALVDLEGEAFNQFSIRSATPFEVKMRVKRFTGCDESASVGAHTFSVSGQDGWGVQVGTGFGGVVDYVYNSDPNADEISVIYCADADFSVGVVSMENTLVPIGPPNRPVKYGVYLLDENDGVIAAAVFWDNNTWGYNWYADGHNFGGTSCRKVKFFGTKCPEANTWQFRNLTVNVL